ncbi:MAG: hypothetical protein ACYDGM_03175 [Vulcanimicrobiaceae bacterium]
MTFLLEAHWLLAFLVVFCAIIFSWNSMGRRVMSVVVGLQFLLGLIVAGVMGAAHETLSPAIFAHILCALGALIAYPLARRLGDRPGGAAIGMALGALGFVLVLGGFYLGLHMAGRV